MAELEYSTKILRFGYAAKICDDNVFVIAKNISEAMEILETIANGRSFYIISHSSYFIVNG
jgi:hypothetical protein